MIRSCVIRVGAISSTSDSWAAENPDVLSIIAVSSKVLKALDRIGEFMSSAGRWAGEKRGSRRVPESSTSWQYQSVSCIYPGPIGGGVGKTMLEFPGFCNLGMGTRSNF